MFLSRRSRASAANTRPNKQLLVARPQANFQPWRTPSTRQNIKMATSSKIELSVDDIGVMKKFGSQTVEAASKISELLQENHHKHHIFFNNLGYHNHIVHHLLALYACGASADIINERYQENTNYQRKPFPLEERIVADLSSPESFKKYLGQERYYHDFLVYFQGEIEKKGWQTVLREHIFAGDERADDLLGRVYSGLLHPLIHLGYGIEFRQPAIIAEALAQVCVHGSEVTDYLLSIEKAITAAGISDKASTKTIPSLLEDIRANKALSSSARWQDGDKVRDGVLKRASEEMVSIAKQFRATPDTLEHKTAEMINACAYFTAAAQNPPKEVKFDFFYIHSLNSSIFFSTFNEEPSFSPETKVRMLNWKVWLDLAVYTSSAAPKLLLEEIAMYTPLKLEAGDAEWKGILRRLNEIHDDGHAVKVGRAIAHAEEACKIFEVEGEKRGFLIKGFMWEKIGNMAIDSVEGGEHMTLTNWVRSTGFLEAWEDFGEKERKSQL